MLVFHLKLSFGLYNTSDNSEERVVEVGLRVKALPIGLRVKALPIRMQNFIDPAVSYHTERESRYGQN